MPPNHPPSFVQRDLFGGEGAVEIWNLKKMQAPPFSAALWCSLEAGGRVGRHRQQDDPEFIICLSGEGIAIIGTTGYPMIEGSSYFLPHGQILSIDNSSDHEALEYLIIKARTS